ncbi:hypothetical protein GCM10010124_39940 [Pilimelia terevasa]|uniref:Uncharacterized protein n=1 Tax=Pilimelia terevasa TaxID=53372 RepID=A0A8J3BS53_9ACTN|nr:hypothetical protein [Pilimelia terevasa]GGK43101.1 hypothetical protein GCM10010124_39940 [Pilimelia terevasa]
MEIEFLGKDPGSNMNGCPSLFRTDQGTYLVQGWVVDDPDTLIRMGIPAGETVVEIPARMMSLFQGRD